MEEMPMIILNAKITLKPGKREEIIPKMQNLIKATRAEPGCINYELYASTEDENVLMMFEKWESREALDSHIQTEHFKAFGAEIEEYLAKEMEIDAYSAEKL